MKSTSENTKLKPRLTAITNPNLKKICGGGEERRGGELRRDDFVFRLECIEEDSDGERIS